MLRTIQVFWWRWPCDAMTMLKGCDDHADAMRCDTTRYLDMSRRHSEERTVTRARETSEAATASYPTPSPRLVLSTRVGFTVRKGTNGVRTNGVTANFSFCCRGTFWVLPLTYLYLPKSARAYLFPICQIHYFCSGPISVDPICPQPIFSLLAPRGAVAARSFADAAGIYIYIYVYTNTYTML